MVNSNYSSAGLAIIAAVAENQVIGKHGKIPWRLKQDLKRFKALTMHHPIIMGRTTFQSIGKPLEGRTNIVLTSRKDIESGVVTARSLDEAIEYCSNSLPGIRPYVIGGSKAYEEALPLADLLHLTRIHKEFDGDAYFPNMDFAKWKLVYASRRYAIGYEYTFETYIK